MSAIDWLGREGAAPAIAPPATGSRAILPPREEPPVAIDARAPTVAEGPIGETEPAAAGLLPMSMTGLPRSLWSRSDPERLTRLIAEVDPAVPALSALLNTLMLAEADPPEGSRDFLATRVRRLVEVGALDAASALLDRAGPAERPLFETWFDVALLTGRADDPCKALDENPRLTEKVAPRVFCAARNGDWPRAALAFETGRALGDLTGRDADLLERFLSPEAAEELPSLPPPLSPTPLQFVLYSAVGEPLPTTALPRAYATSHLSGDFGWKAQIEAVERLVRAGAVSENRFLGIYTEQEPAASGGVWDRVAALQDFEAALAAGETAEIEETLRAVWPLMLSNDLAVPFARLFGQELAELDLEGRAGRIAAEAALLSDGYEDAAREIEAEGGVLGFLSAIARGEAPQATPSVPHAQPIAQAFAENAAPPDDLAEMARSGRLGEAILRAMTLFGSGAAGNAGDLTDALATFRALGLEDTARRAALQLAILTEEPLR
ncbi:hypothetical protein OCH239_01965 [Roseivivax halodurans JCM 10272]|uniref:Uncharacterized protein n=1 Tax=Roseivivax halodurans JCM 10272 TaxID=1449350 RepID=X7EN73_9RHOB|nr:hypothetical protein OCH239_01965 [Roseivivax halodurans JCM 10272]